MNSHRDYRYKSSFQGPSGWTQPANRVRWFKEDGETLGRVLTHYALLLLETGDIEQETYPTRKYGCEGTLPPTSTNCVAEREQGTGVHVPTTAKGNAKVTEANPPVKAVPGRTRGLIVITRTAPVRWSGSPLQSRVRRCKMLPQEVWHTMGWWG